MIHILVVEDDVKLNQTVCTYMRKSRERVHRSCSP